MVSMLSTIYAYVCTMLMYVQCLCMYNAYVCTMLMYVQCLFMYNAYVCTMLMYVQCKITLTVIYHLMPHSLFNQLKFIEFNTIH